MKQNKLDPGTISMMAGMGMDVDSRKVESKDKAKLRDLLEIVKRYDIHAYEVSPQSNPTLNLQELVPVTA